LVLADDGLMMPLSDNVTEQDVVKLYRQMFLLVFSNFYTAIKSYLAD